MKPTEIPRFVPAAGLALLIALMPSLVRAFPPAPNHILHGLVRDQVGNPLAVDNAEIVLEAASGSKVTARVVPQLEPGGNYRLEVPMDSGLTDDLYQPTALLPESPFRLKVRIGSTVYLPMEMAGDLAKLGAPGERTRIDLTLGVDADGNGLPDAWEKSAAALLGRTWTAGRIRPGDLYPGTGMTYREVYLAGIYAVAPEDGLSLRIVRNADGVPRMGFVAVKGRSYVVEKSEGLGQWTAVDFRIPANGAPGTEMSVYQATKTQRLEIEPATAADASATFFRLVIH